MEQAQKNGGRTAKAKQPRPITVVRRDGREPMGLGAAIDALATERAGDLPAAGASLRASGGRPSSTTSPGTSQP
jgi:hypothetical protein